VDQGQEFEDRRENAKSAYPARLDRLDVAVRAEEMNIPGFDFHALHGFNPKRYSVHVNGPWCITFEFEDGDACRIDFKQYH
jgi:proteic killer suppression protein